MEGQFPYNLLTVWEHGFGGFTIMRQELQINEFITLTTFDPEVTTGKYDVLVVGPCWENYGTDTDPYWKAKGEYEELLVSGLSYSEAMRYANWEIPLTFLDIRNAYFECDFNGVRVRPADLPERDYWDWGYEAPRSASEELTMALCGVHYYPSYETRDEPAPLPYDEYEYLEAA